MDAIKFWEELKRMCDFYMKKDNYNACQLCPMNNIGGCDVTTLMGESPKGIVLIVEQWSKAHPKKTNAQKFEEVFRTKIRSEKHLDKDERAFVIETSFPGRVWDGSWLDEEYRERTNEES